MSGLPVIGGSRYYLVCRDGTLCEDRLHCARLWRIVDALPDGYVGVAYVGPDGTHYVDRDGKRMEGQ